MKEAPKGDPVPKTLDWTSWLGPMADRPYAKAYLPFSWRGWWDFVAGAMGDMACHNMDPAFWTCELGLPTSIKAQCSAPATVAYPSWSIITFKFPPSKICPKGITMTWYDGKKLPKPPAGADPKLKVGGNGCMIVGSKMSAMGGSHAGTPSPIGLAPPTTSKRSSAKALTGKTNTRSSRVPTTTGSGLRPPQGDPKAPGSNFEYSAPMSASLALGAIALRFPDTELKWDDKARKFTNHSEANKWVTIDPRKGYDLKV